jgi:hypothetical protein
MKLPKNWNDVTIEMYQALLNNLNDKSLTPIDLIISNITVLSGCEYEDVESLDIREINRLASQLSFISQPAENKAVNDVILDGKIHSLQCDVSKVTYGQFKALSHYTSNNASNDNLHFLMALFVYPKGEPYDRDFFERAEQFRKQLTMDVVFPLSAFFLGLLVESVKISRTYSIKKAEEIIRKTAIEIEKENLSPQQRERLTSVMDGLK